MTVVIETSPLAVPAGYRRIPRTRPAPRRPAGAPLRYRSSGVRMPEGPHRQRRITPATTVGLAVLAALITVWLGVMAQFGASVAESAAVPEQLAVVRVQEGESLPALAVRVAPGAPATETVERIRELNRLDSSNLDAGQTLIAPIG